MGPQAGGWTDHAIGTCTQHPVLPIISLAHLDGVHAYDGSMHKPLRLSLALNVIAVVLLGGRLHSAGDRRDKHTGLKEIR